MEKEYEEYCKKFSHCLPYATVRQQLQIQPQGYNDVQSQCHWIADKLKERLKQCMDLMDWFNSYDEKYKENLQFIERGIKCIEEYYSDSFGAAAQLEKCLVSASFVNAFE